MKQLTIKFDVERLQVFANDVFNGDIDAAIRDLSADALERSHQYKDQDEFGKAHNPAVMAYKLEETTEELPTVRF